MHTLPRSQVKLGNEEGCALYFNMLYVGLSIVGAGRTKPDRRRRWSIGGSRKAHRALIAEFAFFLLLREGPDHGCLPVRNITGRNNRLILRGHVGGSPHRAMENLGLFHSHLVSQAFQPRFGDSASQATGASWRSFPAREGDSKTVSLRMEKL